jgi:hypothetical protein
MSHTDRPADAGSALRRRTVIAISGVAAVAAGVGSCLAIAAGGSSTSPLSSDAVAYHQASGPSDAPATALTIPADYSQPIGRNPFKPLVVPPPPAAPSTNAVSNPAPTSSAPVIPVVSILPAPTVTVTVTATPTVAKTASPSPSRSATPSPSPTTLPTAGQAITLTLVSADTANGTANVTVSIGSTTTPFNDLKPGEVFGTYFKLVSILSDPSTTPASLGAGFQYGDQFVQLDAGESAQLG